MRPFLALLVPALLFAGCADDASDPAMPSSDATLAPSTQTDESEIQWSMDSGVGTPVVSFAPNGFGSGSLDVPANASLLAIDGEWTCDSGPACDITVTLYDGEDIADEQQGQGTVRFEVKDPGEGSWTIEAWPTYGASAVVNAAGTFRVAVTYLEGAAADTADADAESEQA